MLSAWLALGCHAEAAPVAADVGPTPYPTRKEDWPGTGVIRVFDWMMDNRRAFWRQREQARGSIVFAGDSLTASWQGLKHDFPGERIANRGIGGDVSRGLLFRFEEDVLALDPRAVVIMIGINDLTARQPASTTLENIETMLSLALHRHPETLVVLCTTPPTANPRAPVDGEQRALLNTGLAALAQRHQGVTLVDLSSALATSSGAPDSRFFRDDLLHLSAAGYARWSELLVPVLRDAKVLSQP
ncbi:MAG: GDSL-type esterase/lipase family protein [Steroidobacteraceae bacterium]